MRVYVLTGTVIIGFGGLLCAGASSYREDDGPDLDVVEKALELLTKGERSGFDILTTRYPSKRATQRQLDSQAALIRTQMESLGEPCGFELVGAEGVGASMRGYTYLAKYEDGRMRWRFNFYRPKDEWKLEGYWFGTADDNSLYFSAGRKLFDGDSGIAGRPESPNR